jgi:hypothetical protein
LVAADLTPERLEALLRSGGSGALLLARYVASIRSDPVARAAFLDALGPAGFAELLDVTGRTVVRLHQATGSKVPAAAAADEVLGALAGVWSTARAAGDVHSAGWDRAVATAPLYAAGRVLEVAAATPGALTTAELTQWASTTWRRLIAAFGTEDAAWPSLVGDHVLAALANDGRAARSFLLDLAADPTAFGALLANVASAPEVTGRLLLASTDPTTVTSPSDDDEVRRSMQAVLRTADGLLSQQRAAIPHVSGTGVADVAGTGWVLPTDLGTYAGRYIDRLVDPHDGSPLGSGSITSYAWPGWRDREVAGILRRFARDPLVAAQLEDATLARSLQRIGEVDLRAGEGDRVMESAAYDIAAVRALRRDDELDHVLHDRQRFDQMVSGADLVVTVVGIGGPDVVAVPTEGWAWLTRAGGVTGRTTPGALLLSPFEPRSVRDALASQRASSALDVAVLKSAVASIAFAQLQAAGVLTGPAPVVPAAPDEQARDLAHSARPGDNANAPGDGYSAQLDAWLDQHRDEPAGQLVEQLMDSAGDASALGAGWVA